MTSSFTPAFDLRKVTDAQLIGTIYGEAPDDFNPRDAKENLKLLRKDNRAAVLLLKRLTHTGSATAREMVAARLRDVFSDMVEARSHQETDEYWRYRCEHAWHPRLSRDLRGKWNVGNVIEEIGSDPDRNELASSVAQSAHNLSSSEYPMTINPDTNEYWRGLAALSLSKVFYKADKALRARAQAKARYDYDGTINEFVEWAGAHEDIATLIETAKKRRTISVLRLQGVVEESKTPAQEEPAA